MKIAPAPLKRRGRPLSFDRDKTLDCVIPLFWRMGYDAPSLDELAASAGLNRTNIRAAFGSKKELFCDSLRRFRDQFSAGAQRALEAPETLREALTALFEYAVSVYSANGWGCLIFSIAPTASVGEPEIARELSDAMDLVRRTIETRLTLASAIEIAKREQIPAIAEALLGIFFSLAGHARCGADPARLREIYRRGLEVTCCPQG